MSRGFLTATQEITDKQDVGALHQRQVDALKEYIAKVNLTADHDSEDCNFYGEILKKVIVIDYRAPLKTL